MIHSKFEIEYRVTGSGWAKAIVRCGDDRVELSASYLSDALGQLATAALLMRMGSQSARVSFDEEPGEYRWGFDRLKSPSGDAQVIHVRIWFFEELWGCRPDKHGRIVLDALVDTDSFFRAIRVMLDDVLNRYGEKGYAKRWVDAPYPKAIRDELNRLG